MWAWLRTRLMALVRRPRIACTLGFLLSAPVPLSAQPAGGEGILGLWYAATRLAEDGTTVPIDYRTQWFFLIQEYRGQFFVNSGYTQSSFQIVRRGENSFETVQGPRYTLRLLSPEEMVFEGNGRSLRFDRLRRDLTAPVPVESRDVITFKEPWARRQWFEGVRQRFQAEYGRSLEACFSDRTCLATCPVSAATCADLGAVIETYLEQDQERDPLFVDRIAAEYFKPILSQREQLLRFRGELENAKVRSLAAARDATRAFFLWLAVDTGSEVAIDEASEDDRNRTAEMIEVVGCTVAGYIPVVGDAVATQCALKSATGIATTGTSLAGSNLQGISLNRVMQGLIDAEARYHDIAYDKYNGIFDHALTDEAILSGIVKTIRDGRLAIPRALSDDEMKAAMWAAVWPYAFYGYGVGPTAVTEIEDGSQDVACEVQAQDGEFAVSVHEHLDKGAARSGTRAVNQYAVFRWSLRTGSIENGRPLEPAARQSLGRYLRSQQQDGLRIFAEFKSAKRLFVESRYRVYDQWNWWPPVKFENLLSFPSSPGVIRYDDELPTVGVAQVGQSVQLEAGKRAIGRTACARFVTF